MTSVSGKPQSRVLAEFGFGFSVMLVLMFCLLLPWLFGHARPMWPLLFAGLLSCLALVKPLWLRLPFKLWMRFADVLGYINTRIIMFLIFYLVIFPMGIVMRVVQYDPMRKRKPNDASYRVDPTIRRPDSMEKPY